VAKKKYGYSDENRKEFLQRWLIPRLRRISQVWPGKNLGRKKAERKVHNGYFKNGNPKYITKFECNGCKNLFNREETEMNHVDPVVKESGFEDWNNHMDRLFCGSTGYECLCINCHKSETKKQNILRRMIKKGLTTKKKSVRISRNGTKIARKTKKGKRRRN